MSTEKPLVVFMLGGPGSGKGTQCKLIEEKFGFTHISAGDCLREYLTKCEKNEVDKEHQAVVEDCINNGKIVPVRITVGLMKAKMQDEIEKKKRHTNERSTNERDTDKMNTDKRDTDKMNRNKLNEEETVKQQNTTYITNESKEISIEEKKKEKKSLSIEEEEKLSVEKEKEKEEETICVEKKNGSKKNKKIEEYEEKLKYTNILENKNIIEILKKNKLKEKPKYKFIIDGFPRNQDNFSGWIKYIGSYAYVHLCVFLYCDEDTMIKRCIDRGLKGGRVDDNMETLKKRFETHKNDSLPIINLFLNEDKCIFINANNSVQNVWEDIQYVFSNL